MPACKAWGYPRVELRAANSWPAITLDVDGTAAIAALITATTTGELPLPNLVVMRRESGNLHASWFLSSPVHRGDGARWRPQAALTRVAEYYRQAVGADPGYTGVLSLNPMYAAHRGAFKAAWGRQFPYELRELAAVIPFGWRMPTVKSTGIGRNVDLFRAAMRESGKPSNWGRDVTPLLIAMNAQLPVPLDRDEALAIARSVNRINRRNLATGRTQRTFTAIQARRGYKSGAARRKGSPLEHDREPWRSVGLSRASWYRRDLHRSK